MAGTGTQYRSPLILQLVKNREEQQAADAAQNSEQPDHRLQLFARQPTEEVDFGPVMEWVGVFFRVFWLAVFSGGCLLVWVFVLKLAGF
jgi:hypothetical protein